MKKRWDEIQSILQKGDKYVSDGDEALFTLTQLESRGMAAHIRATSINSKINEIESKIENKTQNSRKIHDDYKKWNEERNTDSGDDISITMATLVDQGNIMILRRSDIVTVGYLF